MYRYQELAQYNAERARGLVHTPEWIEKMREQQERFDAEQRQRLVAQGGIESDGMWIVPQRPSPSHTEGGWPWRRRSRRAS